MNEFSRGIKKYLRGCDFFLLTLCVLAASFGCVLVSSAARTMRGGAAPYVNTQITSIIIGVVMYLIVTAIDMDWVARLWKFIIPFNLGFVALLIPFGFEGDSGNRSWMRIPGIPFNIQANEVVKVTFIILLAAHIYFFKDRINRVLPFFSIVAHTLFMVAYINFISSDLGVSLIYIAILVSMMLGAGIKARWFAIGVATVSAAAPLVWTMVLTERQKMRIINFLNPKMDPEGTGWHALLSMNTVGSGGLLGQGLYNGKQAQLGVFPGRHTDFIFSICAEELGFVGCLAVLLLLSAIIVKIVITSSHAKNGLGALICFGVAGMMFFQTFQNVCMCVGLTPVIGVTLPFFSYGGSSNIVLFTAMGLVSSVRMHPKKTWLDY